MCFFKPPAQILEAGGFEDLKSASRVSAALSLIFFRMTFILVESVSRQSLDVGLELTILVEIGWGRVGNRV